VRQSSLIRFKKTAAELFFVKAVLEIIIVNWNSGSQLRQCLKSIVSANQEDFDLNRVMVVDNASTDGSLDEVENIGLPLTIIRNAENRGFAAACNQGSKGSTADYLLFLNPDTLLFPDSLSKPIRFMQHPENKRIGICGIQLVDEVGNVARTCAHFPIPSMFFSKMLGLDHFFPVHFHSHLMAEWDHTNSREVNQVMGSFFLVKRSLFASLGGFDERFFVYFEEVDFSLRAKAMGWNSFYLSGTQVYHKGGGTSGQIKATRLFYSLESRIIYGYKHFKCSSAIILMLATLMLEPFTRLAFALFNRSFLQAKYTLKGYAMLWRAMPQLFRSITKGNSQ